MSSIDFYKVQFKNLKKGMAFRPLPMTDITVFVKNNGLLFASQATPDKPVGALSPDHHVYVEKKKEERILDKDKINQAIETLSAAKYWFICRTPPGSTEFDDLQLAKQHLITIRDQKEDEG